MKDSNGSLAVVSASNPPVGSSSSNEGESFVGKKSLRRRIRAIVWDTFERTPEERRFIAKIDFFILTWAGFTYFSKNLNTNNICQCRDVERLCRAETDSFPANAYVSGMKEELNVVGNEYQT